MKTIDPEKILRLKKRWIPLVPVFALLIFSMSCIVRPPWFDEVLTIGWLSLDFAKIPCTYPIPNNHIVYTMLLSLWNGFADYDLMFMRSLSLLGGMLAIYLITRRVIRQCGLLYGTCASLCLAFSGPFALFSTALRGYIFALLFCFVAFLMMEKWFKRDIVSGYGVLYFLFCCLAVGVMPTCLFALGAQVLFFVPLMFRSRKKFFHVCLAGLLPVLALLLCYAHIFDQLVKAFQLREGWTSFSAAYWNLYGTWLFMMFPVVVFSFWGAVLIWKRHPVLRLRLICSALIFLTPLFLAVLAKVPPFPRVFFPFFGIWIVISAMLLTPLLRLRIRYVAEYFFVLTMCCIALAVNVTPSVSAYLFGGPRTDDLLHPYPVSSIFMPWETAKCIKQLDGETPIFIDFDADPPSLSFALLSRDIAENRILYDRPDRGPVTALDSSALIVCTSPEALEGILKRFQLQGEYECIFDKGMQKVYRKK